jgi:uncharacterized protein (DUF1015 family)
MAEVKPLTALHYDLALAGSLETLIAPPYDVIDATQRAELASRSPFNVVHIDLPEGDDPYTAAADQLEAWELQGVVARDREPALWALRQDFTTPDGKQATREGFFARVRVTEYGAGRIRPHERTHPGPKEDRLRLTRATRTNLSPIFSLYDDPDGNAWNALKPALGQVPWGTAVDDEGTVNTLWRIADPAILATVEQTLDGVELLIADGHHRYETARAYADEVGGEGPHRYTLMCLVSLQDPGLEVFPTHRLVKKISPQRQEALAKTIKRDFEITEVSRDELAPPPGDGPLELGYVDSHFKRPFRLALKDQALADAALADKPDAYRQLDTGVLEALLLKGALGLSDDDISHLNDFGYARDAEQALELVESGSYDVAFVMRPTPVATVRDVAASGENMPPKSTYFFPKIPTGLLFNPLE